VVGGASGCLGGGSSVRWAVLFRDWCTELGSIFMECSLHLCHFMIAIGEGK
jgi:hypothetical protein